jgi:hypothetical protein
MKNFNLKFVSILTVIFILVVAAFGEALALRDGAVLFLSFAISWFIGTIIKIYWPKIKAEILSTKDEDISMDEQV